MNRSDHILKTEQFVKRKLEGEGTGHDWWHIHRVRNVALEIARNENADKYIVELSALLHDIADHKFHDGDLNKGAEVSSEWLNSLNVDRIIIDEISTIVTHISFKGAEVEDIEMSLEGKIVQDADRLDAMGSIGIARAFAYGGYKKRELYNPEIAPVQHDSFEKYRKSESPSLNHFYEKLFLLKDRMHTDYAKKMAEERHQFMEDYVNRFLSEWDGKI